MKSDKSIAQDLAIEKCYKKNEKRIYNKSLLLVADTSSIDTGFKVIVKDMYELESVIDGIKTIGSTKTSVILSTPIQSKSIL